MDDGPKISFLPFETINWMNKRRPGLLDSSKAASLVTPSRAIQLKQIFQGLDFDGSGEISLEEMQDAITYVGELDPGIDADKINKFFVSMDADGNGVIDFGEFIAAMSLDKGDGGAERNQRMQNAFFNFANNHRRKTLIDSIEDKSRESIDRYKEFSKLFEFDLPKERAPGSLAEELIRAKTDAISDKEAISKDQWIARQKEFDRSRRAQVHFDTFKKRDRAFGDGSLNKLIKTIDLPGIDSEYEKTFARNAHKTLANRMSKYMLNDKHTNIPPIEILKRDMSSSSIKLQSMKLARKMKNEQRANVTNIPPTSIRTLASIKAKKFLKKEMKVPQ